MPAKKEDLEALVTAINTLNDKMKEFIEVIHDTEEASPERSRAQIALLEGTG